MNLEVEAGDQIATDGNQAANNFQSLKYSVTYKDVNQFGFNYMTDVYGEEDYYADFGLRFPKVVELFYERRLDDGARPSKIRFELLQRDLDSGSGADFGDTTNGTTFDARNASLVHQRLLTENKNRGIHDEEIDPLGAVLSLAVTGAANAQRAGWNLDRSDYYPDFCGGLQSVFWFAA